MTLPKVIRGRAWKFGANIDTDQIIPAKRRKGVRPPLRRTPRSCDSVRATLVRGGRSSLVIADSYARIFFRNAINMGYPILQSPQAAEAVEDGDELEVDLEEGVIRNFTKGDEYRSEAFPKFMNELLRMGGLVPWVRKQLEERRRMAASRG